MGVIRKHVGNAALPHDVHRNAVGEAVGFAADGSAEPYSYSYLFAYPIDVPRGSRTLTLPDSDRIRILAVTVAEEPWVMTPAHPLYDTLERNER